MSELHQATSSSPLKYVSMNNWNYNVVLLVWLVYYTSFQVTGLVWFLGGILYLVPTVLFDFMFDLCFVHSFVYLYNIVNCDIKNAGSCLTQDFLKTMYQQICENKNKKLH